MRAVDRLLIVLSVMLAGLDAGPISAAEVTAMLGTTVTSSSSVLGITPVSAIIGQPVTTGTPPSYLVSDNFEYVDAAAANAGSWMQAGSPVWGYANAPAPLQGAYSLALDSATDEAYLAFAPAGDLWLYFVTHLAPGGALLNTQFVYLLDAAGVQVGEIRVRSGGQVRILHGTAAATPVTSASTPFAAGATRHVWVHWTIGTGSNGTMDVYVSDSPTRGLPAASIAAGSGLGLAATNVARVRFGPTGNAFIALCDRLRLSNTAIGDNPP